MNNDTKYNESSVEILEGLEAVRKRPAMYIGTTSKEGLHHLIWEIVDNSIDETLAGVCNKIEVIVHRNGSITVSDNGRGIPVGIHEKSKKSVVETILTIIHAGGKFNNKAYKVSGGLHGVGASVVNALSEYLNVTVYRDGYKHEQKFTNGGRPVSAIKKLEKVPASKTGTTITFLPDKEIFHEGIDFDLKILRNRLRELAFLNQKLLIKFICEAEESEEEFYYENGIKEYVKYINDQNNTLTKDVFYVNKTLEEVEVEICLQYTTTDWTKIYSYCNNILTKEGGMHLEGFRLAITKTINNYIKKNKLFKTDTNLIYEDIKEGLTAIICVKHKDPQFEGQTKTKLGSFEVKRITNTILSEALEKYYLENPLIAKTIVEKCALSYKARLAAKKAREQTKRKSALNSFNLPGKLADCISRNPAECELYIVEGDSAGTTAKLGRDRHFQAILSLKGKVLNVERAQESKIYNNTEITSLIASIGAGFHEQFNIENLKYHKIIIMTDADVDGSHIKVLLLTLFYRYMQPLIANNHVYIACPPLYRVTAGNKSFYATNDDDLKVKLKKLKNTKYTLQRFKGLGEMNADQLWNTTMNPAERNMIKININDIIDSDHTFSNLMGSDPQTRKEFIINNSSDGLLLDI